VGHAPLLDGVLQYRGYVYLAYYFIKRLWAPFPGKYYIRHYQSFRTIFILRGNVEKINENISIAGLFDSGIISSEKPKSKFHA